MFANNYLSCLQLAIDNVLAPYLGNQFGFSITKAANLAAIFGMLNFVARPFGGYLSDVCGRRYDCMYPELCCLTMQAPCTYI